jgi:hypothetical protein
MAKNWVARQLSSLFGQADTSYWGAVLKLMEHSFGRVIIDTPIEGGNIRAFFEKQVLIGDVDSITTERSKKKVFTVDMDEPIGLGKTHQVAVIDLWKKLTTLNPHENILLFVRKQEDRPFAEYTSFQFKDGNFTGEIECSECPPDRHPIIQKYMDENRFDRLIGPCEDNVVGVRRPA